MSENDSHPKPKKHAPGIYFGLDEAAYHDDAALGSTDIKALASSPPQFWFNSKFNAAWEPYEERDATILGSARHKFVLEGMDAFKACYSPKTLNGATKDGKAEVQAIRDSGRIPIKLDEYNRILQIGTIIRSNPSIRNAFSGGGGSEVSIFWEEDGIPRKCRIDYIKKNANVDLKSVANQFGEPFPNACRKAITKYRYDIQAAHYLMGRRAAVAHWKAGRVFGDCPDADAFAACMHPNPTAWVWIFYQSADAPLTWGRILSPQNPIMNVALDSIAKAEDNWREYMDRFGPDVAWIHDEPLGELDINELPQWFARE